MGAACDTLVLLGCHRPFTAELVLREAGTRVLAKFDEYGDPTFVVPRGGSKVLKTEFCCLRS
jgi:hypothetical protein